MNMDTTTWCATCGWPWHNNESGTPVHVCKPRRATYGELERQRDALAEALRKAIVVIEQYHDHTKLCPDEDHELTAKWTALLTSCGLNKP